MKRQYLLLGLCFMAAPLLGQTERDAPGFEAGTLDYAISFDGTRIHWKEFAFFVMPGQTGDLQVHAGAGQSVAVDASSGQLVQTGPMAWRWQAPMEAGPQTLTIRPESASPATLHLIVQVSASGISEGYLNGYRIGDYPQTPLRGNPIYLPPPGFIEVHPDMMDLRVSPHFTLGQFLCKQQPEQWPKYLVLREQLIVKLELILAEVNRRGIRTDTFHIMSGYRTPWYNRSIGNVPYSRHVWGGAADIFIDTDGNDRMDDINHDGRVGIRDARLLRSIIDELYHAGRFERLIGGLGLYGPKPHRGPFVHVDARGEPARWETP